MKRGVGWAATGTAWDIPPYESVLGDPECCARGLSRHVISGLKGSRGPLLLNSVADGRDLVTLVCDGSIKEDRAG